MQSSVHTQAQKFVCLFPGTSAACLRMYVFSAGLIYKLIGIQIISDALGCYLLLRNNHITKIYIFIYVYNEYTQQMCRKAAKELST